MDIRAKSCTLIDNGIESHTEELNTHNNDLEIHSKVDQTPIDNSGNIRVKGSTSATDG